MSGFNETTHHVLLYGLSSLPLPKCVQHLTLIVRTHPYHSGSSPRWIWPDTTLSIASITGLWHNMAQASTRYARLLGLAIYCDNDRSCKGVGSSTATQIAVESHCPNALKWEQERESGIVSNMLKGGVACLFIGRTQLFFDVIDNYVSQVYPQRQTRYNLSTANASQWCMSMTCQNDAGLS